MLALVTRRFRVPLIWSVIEGRGCSDTGMRIALIERYLAHFPAKTIRLLLADRELTGADWMEFLCKNNIPFAIRVRDNLRITTEEGHDLTLRARLRQARRGRSFRARLGTREDAAEGDAPLLNVAAKPLKGDWLIIVQSSRRAPPSGSAANAGRSNACSAMPRPVASISRTRASLIHASSACSCLSQPSLSAGPDAPPQTSSANVHHCAKAMATMPNPGSEPASTTSEIGSDPILSMQLHHGTG